MNIVDVDTHELVASWLLCITTTPPVIARSYDVDFYLNHATNGTNNGTNSNNGNGDYNGVVLHKKIIFKNPWDIGRKFVLISSNDNVMKSRFVVVCIGDCMCVYIYICMYALSYQYTISHSIYTYTNYLCTHTIYLHTIHTIYILQYTHDKPSIIYFTLTILTYTYTHTHTIG